MGKGKKTKGTAKPNSGYTSDSIESQLSSFNLELFDVSGDGNCLFRAIAHQMDNTQNNHLKYRTQTVAHMRENKELYAPFLDEDETIDQRLKRMEKQGVYGDNLEIVAFSRAFKCGVVIHQVGQSPWVVDACGDDGNGNAADRRSFILIPATHRNTGNNNVAPSSGKVERLINSTLYQGANRRLWRREQPSRSYRNGRQHRWICQKRPENQTRVSPTPKIDSNPTRSDNDTGTKEEPISKVKERKPSAKEVRMQKKKERKENSLAKKRNPKSAEPNSSLPSENSSSNSMNAINVQFNGISI
ncbi:cysteine proteinase [Rhizoclosmatium globosum]|uniref:Cysteine proteinase n=1 Tax=Rhizoclosmatium globosum TaxID=329046 RepID=A0A1Y2CF75_9FUNG|nr:cysteine proteinase [Rhizoclosmatium globosum]|eukprot:ORY45679.1 cysteine proteinase [Rhizoclosmatium globosum]